MRRQPPPDDAILCEKCGYILDHLPVESNCPECGKPVRESAEGLDRRPPIVERDGPSIRTRVMTMNGIIGSPFTYFRSLSIMSHPYEGRFRWHMMLMSSLFFGLAGGMHLRWIVWFFGVRPGETGSIGLVFAFAVFFFLAALLISILSEKLVCYFTVIEGRFWGYRLWKDVVKRVMSYHIAHLVPLSFITLLIVGVNLTNAFTQTVRFNPKYYLYVLCAWVLIASFWLMSTYVSAMRAVMFANRIPPVKPVQSERDSASAHPANRAS